MNWKIAIFSLLITGTALAGEFRDANALYDAGKFGEAAAAYEKIEPKTAHVWFNLGNACYRQEQFGRAILYYERARQLSPRDPDILANLTFAQNRAGATEVRPFWQAVLQSRTPREWSAYEIAALWMTVMGVGLWIWLRRYRAVWLTVSMIGLAGVAFTGIALGARLKEQRDTPPSIVLAARVEARFAPARDGTVHFVLTEGARVIIRENRGAWVFVERADGNQGWVESAAVERI